MPISYSWVVTLSTGSQMEVPQSYTWQLIDPEPTDPAPDPGPYVPSIPLFGADPRKKQFERGIKFANVPAGRAEFVVHGGPRVYHVNSLCNIQQVPDKFETRSSAYSGVVKFRFRNYRNFKVPDSVSGIGQSNEWGDPVFSFTGTKK